MTSASCGRSSARLAPSSCRPGSPTFAGATIGALALKPEHRVCEIGTGTGYCAALLAQLAGAVVSLERFQTLALEAAARIKAFGLANVAVRWADGFELHLAGERFDRVLVHGLMEPPGEAFLRLVRPGGILVAAVAGPDRGEQHIVRLTRKEGAGALRALRRHGTCSARM